MTYWSDKLVVVTGGAGFIGTALVRKLAAAGANVTVLDDFSRGWQRVEGVKYVQGDAGNLLTCFGVFDGADAVFNLAAHVAGVTYNRLHHAEMFQKNLLLQIVPMVAVKQLGLQAVQVSSACIYAPEHNHPAQEKNGFLGEPNEANMGYALAKRIGERVTKMLGAQHVVVRPSNTYGPGDHYDKATAHVIPALIKKCYDSGGTETWTVLGSGQEEREFIYVDDVADGMMAAFEHGNPYGVYNLGTSGATKTTIAGLVIMLSWLIWGHTLPKVEYTGGSGGDEARWSDSSRAKERLGWEHKIDLDIGIHRTLLDYEHRFQVTPGAHRLAIVRGSGWNMEPLP